MLWAVWVLMFLPAPDVVELRVDVVELNHVYQAVPGPKPQAERVLSQWILWEWRSDIGRYCVVYWLKAEAGTVDGRALRVFHGRLYVIRAAVIRETWTLFDPEQLDRETWPTWRRRRLWLQ